MVVQVPHSQPPASYSSCQAWLGAQTGTVSGAPDLPPVSGKCDPSCPGPVMAAPGMATASPLAYLPHQLTQELEVRWPGELQPANVAEAGV